ncbi:MAG: ferrochelatase [Myxococcota bacterium]
MQPLVSHPLDRNWQPQAVLLLAYGAARCVEEVPAFVRHVRGGRETSAHQLQETTERYRQIGGRSPLHDVTNRTACQLQEVLHKPVYVGMRHSQPFIHETLAEMANQGVQSCVVICLAPHHSSMSIGAYHKALATGLQDLSYDLQYAFVQAWHNHPLLVRLWARAVKRILQSAGLSANQLQNSHRVLFSAHSLPERIVQQRDPYPHQLRKTAQLVALHAGLASSSWELVFQSAPPSCEAWLGPQIEDRLPQIAAQGVKDLFVAPIGFVSDHLEVLYDLDILACRIAQHNKMQLHRATMPNDTSEFIAVLQGLVQGICKQV